MTKILFGTIVIGTVLLVAYAIHTAIQDHAERRTTTCGCGDRAHWWLDVNGVESAVCHTCFGAKWNRARRTGATCSASYLD